jgi:SAM-dependent methyltransferase
LVVDHARKIGAVVAVTAIDQQGSTLQIARDLSLAYPEINFVQADALSFDPAGEFDLVMCSLALHHFSEADAIRLLIRCREMAGRFVLVADLRRSRLTTIGVHLLTALIFREPMTRTDGRLSAQRAFSFRELGALAQRAGWQNFGQARYRFARQAIWLGAAGE